MANSFETSKEEITTSEKLANQVKQNEQVYEHLSPEAVQIESDEEKTKKTQSIKDKILSFFGKKEKKEKPLSERVREDVRSLTHRSRMSGAFDFSLFGSGTTSFKSYIEIYKLGKEGLTLAEEIEKAVKELTAMREALTKEYREKVKSGKEKEEDLVKLEKDINGKLANVQIQINKKKQLFFDTMYARAGESQDKNIEERMAA